MYVLGSASGKAFRANEPVCVKQSSTRRPRAILATHGVCISGRGSKPVFGRFRNRHGSARRFRMISVVVGTNAAAASSLGARGAGTVESAGLSPKPAKSFSRGTSRSFHWKAFEFARRHVIAPRRCRNDDAIFRQAPSTKQGEHDGLQAFHAVGERLGWRERR